MVRCIFYCVIFTVLKNSAFGSGVGGSLLYGNMNRATCTHLHFEMELGSSMVFGSYTPFIVLSTTVVLFCLYAMLRDNEKYWCLWCEIKVLILLLCKIRQLQARISIYLALCGISKKDCSYSIKTEGVATICL